MTNAGSMNNNFYASPPTPEEVRRRLAMQQGQQGQQGMQNHGMGMVNTTGIGGPSTRSPLSAMASGGGDSLDDIVTHNTRELQRRRSVPYASFADPLSPQTDDRRMSMMDYTTSDDAFQAFPYGNMSAPQDAMAGLDSFSSGADLQGSSALYSPQGLMAMSNQQIYGTLAPETLGMAAAMSSMDMGSMATNPASMSIFSPPDLSAQYPPAALDPNHIDFAMDMGIGHAPLNAFNVDVIANLAVGGGHNSLLGADQAFDSITPVPEEEPAASLIPDVAGLSPFPAQANVPTPEAREASVPASFRSPAGSTPSRTMPHSSGGQSRAGGGTPVSSGPAVPRDPKKDVYSKSGFDMLRALFYVATRKNPTVEIGAVDMSCAFVVCDLTLNDCPIVYVSDNFQNLTGYNRHEIVGQNCRFLQSPDGKVEAGTKREFVANDAVYKLKAAVAEGREIQQSLINYRKGGKPFLNLLTMIPIPWDTDEMRYCIGFQIDLVECPQAISGQDPGGGMHVNYCHNDIGQYIFSPPSSTHWEPAESGQTLSVDEVSTLVEQFKPSAPPTEWHKQSWDKMLLENADDVIHVLSLKGLFLYLSPACKKILEYDAADLVGTSLSSICHPSDIVPVTRELKDAQPGGGTVDIAFRIRRKHSGYTWFESHGTLLYEQSKGRKYIVLVGRKRPVLTLRRRDVDAAAPAPGLGDSSEMWSKMSCAGMFLFVSSAARSLLDVPAAELEGTSMQELMRKESRAEFGRTIEKARKGAVAGFRHEVLHKRGQLLPAYTVFYPGDVSGPGQKASFLIAQTKVAKGAARVIAGGSKVGGGATTTIAAAMGPAVPFPDAMSGVVMGTQSQLVLTSAEDGGGSEEDDDVFAELKTTRCTSWQYELRQMEKMNRLLAEELTQLMANKKKRKRRKGGGTGAGGSGSGGGNGAGAVRDCANCHRKDTPEWRRGPSGNRDLCNSCGLRWAKQTGKVSPRNSRAGSSAQSVTGGGGGGGGKRGSASTASSNSPAESSPLRREASDDAVSVASSGGQEKGSSFGEPVAGGLDAMGSIREE